MAGEEGETTTASRRPVHQRGRTCMRRALPMAGCGTSPSPPISLEVSTMTTRLCSSSGGTVAEGEGRWRCKGERASGGKASGAPPAAQHIAAQLCRSRQARVHSRSGLKAPAPAPAAAGACPGAGLSPDSTRAISRMTVVLPTPGRPRNRTELGTAGWGGAGWVGEASLRQVDVHMCGHHCELKGALASCRHGL